MEATVIHIAEVFAHVSLSLAAGIFVARTVRDEYQARAMKKVESKG